MSTWLPANRDRGSPHWAKRRTDIQGAHLVPPLIARILADEHHFSDDPPTWPGAPPSRAAKNTRKRHIKRLRRFAPGIPKADQLAKILARCKRRRRCMSGACPECGRAFQRWFVAEVKNLARNKSLLTFTALSIAFPRHRTAEDKLDMLNTTKMKRGVTETVKESELVHWMAGGIDLSPEDPGHRLATAALWICGRNQP
jgi:hypothetical protein